MTAKRFRTGKGILEEGYFSETIIDNETGKTYYKGYANYKSSKEICELLNKLIDDNDELKEENEQLHEENIQLKNELQFRNCVGKSAQILTRSDWEDLE